MIKLNMHLWSGRMLAQAGSLAGFFFFHFLFGFNFIDWSRESSRPHSINDRFDCPLPNRPNTYHPPIDKLYFQPRHSNPPNVHVYGNVCACTLDQIDAPMPMPESILHFRHANSWCALAIRSCLLTGTQIDIRMTHSVGITKLQSYTRLRNLGYSKNIIDDQNHTWYYD